MFLCFLGFVFLFGLWLFLFSSLVPLSGVFLLINSFNSDPPNNGASCCALGIVGKSSTNKGALSWFHNFVMLKDYYGKVIRY